MNQPTRSALVDLAMPEASEGERADAARHWFNLLSILIRIVDEEDRKRRDSRESNDNARVANIPKVV